MAEANKDVMLMIRTQVVYDRISLALAERATPPEDVQLLQEANRVREQELAEMEGRKEELVEEIREVHKTEEECQLELEHFQRQKSVVTNEREFTAVINEIDFATRALSEANQRREALEAESETITAQIEEHRAKLPEEVAAQRDVTDAWEQRKTELTQQVHDLAIKAKEYEEAMQPANRSRFLRLLESKSGKAMAEVTDGSCSLCHFALRPHLQQRVRRGQEIIRCEHCRRILFLAEMMDPDPVGSPTV